MKTILALLTIVPLLAGASTNNVTLDSKTFMKIEPLWKPTAGQKACGTNYFSTTVNEFDRIIKHMVYNEAEDLSTSITREYTPGGKSNYRVMICTYTKRPPTWTFSTVRPLEFMVDGTRFSYPSDAVIVLRPRYMADIRQYQQSYHCPIDEPLVRALGTAERASVRVPYEIGNEDHDYGPVELRRFKLFATHFLPVEESIIPK